MYTSLLSVNYWTGMYMRRISSHFVMRTKVVDDTEPVSTTEYPRNIRIEIHVLCIRQPFLQASKYMLHSLLQEVPSRSHVSDSRPVGHTLHQDHHFAGDLSVAEA